MVRTIEILITTIFTAKFFFVALGQSPLDEDNGPYLYDLAADPTESTNLYAADSHAQVLGNIEERLDFFLEAAANVVYDFEQPSDRSIWESAGGIVPWLNIDEGPPAKEQQEPGQATSAAPNLVFILLDDVGLNDGKARHDTPLLSLWLLFIFEKKNTHIQ